MPENIGGTLTGPEIKRQVGLDRIHIEPFNVRNINPASIDLTLGKQVSVFKAFTFCEDHHRNASEVPDGRFLAPKNRSDWVNGFAGLDTRNPGCAADLETFEIGKKGWWLIPGVCYLMHVAETVHTEHFAPVVDGKSSFGRLFVKVHFTAGWGDPGFNGQFTLEVMSQFPVKVYAGQRVCQLRFQTLEGEVLSYQKTGHYKGEAAKGAVGSRIAETSFNGALP